MASNGLTITEIDKLLEEGYEAIKLFGCKNEYERDQVYLQFSLLGVTYHPNPDTTSTWIQLGGAPDPSMPARFMAVRYCKGRLSELEGQGKSFDMPSGYSIVVDVRIDPLGGARPALAGYLVGKRIWGNGNARAMTAQLNEWANANSSLHDRSGTAVEQTRVGRWELRVRAVEYEGHTQFMNELNCDSEALATTLKGRGTTLTPLWDGTVVRVLPDGVALVEEKKFSSAFNERDLRTVVLWNLRAGIESTQLSEVLLSALTASIQENLSNPKELFWTHRITVDTAEIRTTRAGDLFAEVVLSNLEQVAHCLTYLNVERGRTQGIAKFNRKVNFTLPKRVKDAGAGASGGKRLSSSMGPPNNRNSLGGETNPVSGTLSQNPYSQGHQSIYGPSSSAIPYPPLAGSQAALAALSTSPSSSDTSNTAGNSMAQQLQMSDQIARIVEAKMVSHKADGDKQLQESMGRAMTNLQNQLATQKTVIRKELSSDVHRLIKLEMASLKQDVALAVASSIQEVCNQLKKQFADIGTRFKASKQAVIDSPPSSDDEMDGDTLNEIMAGDPLAMTSAQRQAMQKGFIKAKRQMARAQARLEQQKAQQDAGLQEVTALLDSMDSKLTAASASAVESATHQLTEKFEALHGLTTMGATRAIEGSPLGSGPKTLSFSGAMDKEEEPEGDTTPSSKHMDRPVSPEGQSDGMTAHLRIHVTTAENRPDSPDGHSEGMSGPENKHGLLQRQRWSASLAETASEDTNLAEAEDKAVKQEVINGLGWQHKQGVAEKGADCQGMNTPEDQGLAAEVEIVGGVDMVSIVDQSSGEGSGDSEQEELTKSGSPKGKPRPLPEHAGKSGGGERTQKDLRRGARESSALKHKSKGPTSPVMRDTGTTAAALRKEQRGRKLGPKLKSVVSPGKKHSGLTSQRWTLKGAKAASAVSLADISDDDSDEDMQLEYSKDSTSGSGSEGGADSEEIEGGSEDKSPWDSEKRPGGMIHFGRSPRKMAKLSLGEGDGEEAAQAGRPQQVEPRGKKGRKPKDPKPQPKAQGLSKDKPGSIGEKVRSQVPGTKKMKGPRGP